jgi:hypothetical protein
MKQKFYNVVKKEKIVDEGFSYTYELLLREGVRTDDFGLPLYSIRISMTDSDGRNSQREATDVFADGAQATRFFDKLVRNLATPIDLGYVVEDEVMS